MQFFYSGRYLPHRRMVFLAVILTLILTLWPDWVYQALAAPDPKPVEIEALRTENSKTFLKPDQKTYVLQEYLQPIHYKQNGKWVDINNNVQSAGKSALDSDLPYINGGNRFRVGFANHSRGKKVVRFRLGQAEVDFGLIGGANTTAKKKENQVTYPDVYPDTDLTYTVTNTGVKEAWVLHKYTGQLFYTLSVKTKNVKAEEQKDGSIAFVDAKGKTLFSIPRPCMYDAKDGISNNVKFVLRTEGNETYIDLKPDDAWLKDPSRAFPVTIDPSISVQGATNTYDATVGSGNAQNVNFGTNSYLLTGTYTDPTYGTGVYRSYIKFGLAPLLSSANITSAKLTLYQYATTQSEQVDLYSVASDWQSTGIKWSQLPSTGSLITSTTVSDVGFYDFDITSLVKQWYGGTTSNYGMMLRLNQESDNWKGFRSSDYPDNNSQKPMLTITYTIDPIGVESFWTSAVTNINTYNGNFYLEDSDVSIDGRGTGLSIERSYNSRSTASGIFMAGRLTWNKA